MSLGRRFNAISVLTVYLGLLTFCLADDRPTLAVVCTLVSILGYVAGAAGDGWRPVCLPRAVVNLLVLGAIINAALHASRAHVGQPIVSHLGEFLVYVQLLKLFDRRTARDESQLLTLSLFVVIAAMLTSNTLPVGVCLFLYTPAALTAAMLYQLHAGQRQITNRPTTGTDGTQPPRPPASAAKPVIAAGRHAARQFRLVAVVSLLAATAMAAIVFALTPRGLGAGALGQFGQASITRTGFNDEIKLGHAGFLDDNSTPVLDLTVEDAAGASLGSPDHPYYLRGVTRDRYTPPIWTSSTPPETRPRAISVQAGVPGVIDPAVDAGVGRGMRVIQRITLRSPSEDAVLFTLWRPITLTANQPSSFTVEADDMSLRRNGSVPSNLSYVIQSSPTEGVEAPEPPPPPAHDAFAGPIRDLARSVLTENGVAIDPAKRDRPANRQAAAAIRDYLRTHCEYSRELDAPDPGQDPIEMFLFKTRRGHCEYFASAMVAMCQSVGLSARLVVGYVAADYNTLTRKYLVRQSDAHAWTEVHVGGGVWQVFDPTPASGVSALRRQSRGWLAALRNWYDTIEFGWNRSVIGFDANAQGSSAIGRRFNFGGVRRFVDDLSGRLFVAARRLRSGGISSLPTGWIVPAVVGVAAAVLLWRGLRRRGRSRPDRGAGPRTGRGRPQQPGLTFYSDALRSLRRAGEPKPDSIPPLLHAEHLRSRSPSAADRLAEISRVYYRVRFGGSQLSESEAAEINRHVAELRAALRMHGRRTD